MRFQFTLRSLLSLTAIVSVFLLLRDAAVMGRREKLAYCIPPTVGALGGVYAGFVARGEKRSLVFALKRGAALGGLLGAAAAAALIVEIGEGLRRSTNGEYWNWGRDWSLACKILLVEMAASTTSGLVAAAAGQIPTRRAMRRSFGPVKLDLPPFDEQTPN